MLNLSALFYTEVEFEPCLFDNLSLRDDDRKDIAAAKNDVRMALRDGIPRVYAAEGHPGKVPQPRFFTQGSWAYKTLNAPAQEPQQADVDDGCYLPLGFLTLTDSPSVAANVFFGVAEKALADLVKEKGWKLSGKPTCIRVEISDLAHIDIPLYAIPDKEFETLVKAETIRRAPKALLHDHLDGGLRPATVVELAEQDGYITANDAEKIGSASVLLGAGRQKKGDPLDFAAGITLHKKRGDYVHKGESLATFYGAADKFEAAAAEYRSGLVYGAEKPEEAPLVYALVTKDGVERY